MIFDLLETGWKVYSAVAGLFLGLVVASTARDAVKRRLFRRHRDRVTTWN